MLIRAVAGQYSSPESRIANKIKMHLTKKKTKKKTEYEDVLYFDLQPHPIACTLGSVVMEWKQAQFEIWMLSDDWLMWFNISLNKQILCLWQWRGGGMGMVQHKSLNQYLTAGKVLSRSS